MPMDTIQESDLSDLWQDALSLLARKQLPEATLAMLRSCTPQSLEEGTLVLATDMRLVQKKALANQALIEECLTQAAFEPIAIRVQFDQSIPAPAPIQAPVAPPVTQAAAPAPAPVVETASSSSEMTLWESVDDEMLKSCRATSPLIDQISDNDSNLTFERFVQGDENIFAYQAALQVAEGENKAYNPLFIYGKSGLGKTHLLRAIQNYIEKNDYSRICVYKESTTFIDDYVRAMKDREHGAPETLKRDYHNIDVLIIDDIQKMAGAGRTIDFFFDTFNFLTANGKQIVLAADRSPAQLGMGKDHFDERVTSRIDSGFTTSISVPNYELKVRLINTFVERLSRETLSNQSSTPPGKLSLEDQKFMAEQAGSNIRVIEGFCQSCIIQAGVRQANGQEFTHDDIQKIAREKWPINRHSITIDEIQRTVEHFYDVSHTDLIGNKRNKELMEPRHVCIWLARELTDNTLADIGKRFGGRTHATVKHSISWVEETRRKDKNLYERIDRVREGVINNS